MLEYVDAHRNCEDIAMAFLLANATGSPPVYVRAPGLQDLGQGVRKVGSKMALATLGCHDVDLSLLVEVCTCGDDFSMIAAHLMVQSATTQYKTRCMCAGQGHQLVGWPRFGALCMSGGVC